MTNYAQESRFVGRVRFFGATLARCSRSFFYAFIYNYTIRRNRFFNTYSLYIHLHFQNTLFSPPLTFSLRQKPPTPTFLPLVLTIKTTHTPGESERQASSEEDFVRLATRMCFSCTS